MTTAAAPTIPSRDVASLAPLAPLAPFSGSGEQLACELEWLELLLRQRVHDASARRTGDEQFGEFAGMYVSEQEIARYATDDHQHARAEAGRRAANDDGRVERLRRELDARAAATSGRAPELRLQRLVRRFALRPLELRVLLCCLAPDWALRFQRYFAYLQNDVGRRRPTVQLLAELCGQGDEAVVARALLSPDAPLLRERLLSLTGAELPFPARQPVVAEAVIDYLSGATRPDAVLAGIAAIRQPVVRWPNGVWYERHRDAANRLARALAGGGRLPTAYVHGPSGSDKSLVTNALAAHAGVRVLRADCRAWTAAGTLSRESMCILRRDALLHGCLIELARCETLLEPAASAARGAVDEFLSSHDGSGIVLTGTAPIEEISAALSVPLWAFEVPRPDLGERADLWSLELAARGWDADVAFVDSLAAAFRFTPREMQRALHGYHTSAAPAQDAPLDPVALVRVCRETSRHTIHQFARRVVPRRGWDDLVLPEDSRVQLEEICAAARCRRRVHAEWGFDRKLSLSTGLNVLFAGPSGVGKTMSAEIVAADLGLDMFAVDLSCVVSKYIGETEKNLSLVFDEAEATNAVLFFDECDALFGKRTEIRDAHDRYANIETNYLLQRIDRYEGIVILATNLRANLDPAFTRRIRYAVEFPFPDAPGREQIWRRMFPREAPLSDDLDIEFLARQFKLTGGSIKNIAVNAAFLAASNGGCLGMKQVIHATRRELQKMGRSCTKAEFGRYYSWVRDSAGAGAAE